VRLAAALLAAALAACDDGGRAMRDRTPGPTFVERAVSPRQRTPGKPPLLVLLHGIGADEDDLVSIAPELDPRFLVVSLRAPRPYHMGFAWFEIEWRADGTIIPNVAQARETLAELVRWIEAAPARLGTDPARLYVLGFSQGAMMTLGLLRTIPERLAGAIVLSGRFSDELFPATAQPDAIARVPLFVAHGAHDDVIPVASGRGIRDAFKASTPDFTYHEYPIPHAISGEEIRTIDAWLTQRLDRPLS